jgi:hypothetical protein
VPSLIFSVSNLLLFPELDHKWYTSNEYSNSTGTGTIIHFFSEAARIQNQKKFADLAKSICSLRIKFNHNGRIPCKIFFDIAYLSSTVVQHSGIKKAPDPDPGSGTATLQINFQTDELCRARRQDRGHQETTTPTPTCTLHL